MTADRPQTEVTLSRSEFGHICDDNAQANGCLALGLGYMLTNIRQITPGTRRLDAMAWYSHVPAHLRTMVDDACSAALHVVGSVHATPGNIALLVSEWNHQIWLRLIPE